MKKRNKTDGAADDNDATTKPPNELTNTNESTDDEDEVLDQLVDTITK